MTEIICATVAQFRPLKDRILLRPLDWEPSKLIHVERRGRPLRGEVMAIGPGHNPMKYKPHPDGQRKIVEYAKRFRPTEVKVGDIVELGGLNAFDGKGYAFTEIVIGTETMIICSERDVAGVHTGDSP